MSEQGFSREFSQDQFNALWGLIDGFQANGHIVDSFTVERGFDGCMVVNVAPLWAQGSVIISKDANISPQIRQAHPAEIKQKWQEMIANKTRQ